jgi:hypothetical protein
MAASERLESVDEREASAEWRGQGWFELKIMRANKDGPPDRFYARPGFDFWCEWKRIGEPLGDKQEIRIKQMRDMGLRVLAPCYTRNQFWRWVRENAPAV